MTTTDMIIRVRQGTRQIDSYVRGALLQEEILLQLNIAQNQYQYVKYKQGESDMKSLVDIRSSQKIDNLTPIVTKTTAITNAVQFEFPEDFRFISYGYVKFSELHLQPFDPVPHGLIQNYILTETNIPVIRTPKGTVHDNKMLIIYDPHLNAPIGFQLHYYRKLVEITNAVSCELPEHTHDAICELAIARLTGRTIPEEYQIASDILTKTE